MYERKYGEKYSEKMSRKEIAAAIRQDLKNAAHAGVFSHAFKFSVRKAPRGRSIRIDIVGAPEGFVVWNPHEDYYRRGESQYAPEADALFKAVTKIGQAYNFDGSEVMVDYFDVNYYLSVNFRLPEVRS